MVLLFIFYWLWSCFSTVPNDKYFVRLSLAPYSLYVLKVTSNTNQPNNLRVKDKAVLRLGLAFDVFQYKPNCLTMAYKMKCWVDTC